MGVGRRVIKVIKYVVEIDSSKICEKEEIKKLLKKENKLEKPFDY